MHISGPFSVLLAAGFTIVFGGIASAKGPFDVQRFEDPGRTILAELADLNGDGRVDLLQVAMRGIPPEEKRVIRVRLQREDGTLVDAPDIELPAPPGAAAYELADLRESPGTELLLLRHRDLLILSFASEDVQQWSLPIPNGTSAGAGEDERGIEQMRMVFEVAGDSPWILVPLFGELLGLSPTGEVLARMSVPSRANFYVPPNPGFYFGESDMQLFFDSPRLSVGDIDGDGAVDLAAANRHEIRVFLQRDGRFSEQPQRTLPLRLVSEKDHIRGSGGVTAVGRDFDGDGKLDLLVSHVAGSFADAHSTATAYLNRDGEWDRENPVGTFESHGALAGDLLVDLDRDGALELVRSEIPMSVLEVIELMVTRAIDSRVRVHAFVDGRFSRKPTAQLKLDIPISFETFRTAGFLPQVHLDVNGDSLPDLLLGGGGDRLEVRIGGQDPPFDERSATQQLPTSGVLRSGDLDGDGLADLLIFNPQEPGGALQLLRNRGVIPGTAPRARAR